jgi:hypothetical protein
MKKHCKLLLLTVVSILGMCTQTFSKRIEMPTPFFTIIPSQTENNPEEISVEDAYDAFLQRQYKAAHIHKALAFTTGGLLLAGGAMGAYHFYDLATTGHRYRDAIGYSEESSNTSLQKSYVQDEWRSSSSQTFRTLHGAIIAASLITYTSTATIELTMPRMSRNPSALSNTNIHKYLFILHASLMAANVGLGFWESHALSTGDHQMVQGLGIAHMVVGFSAPVVMFASGLSFKLPWR